MGEISATLQRVAAEATRAGRDVTQFVLRDSPLKVACVGLADGTAALGFVVAEDETELIGALDDVNGIEFQTQHDVIGPGRWFLIHVVDDEDLGLFGSIADDLAASIATGTRVEALSTLGDLLRRWIDFLRIARKGLSLEKQLGLWGELDTLRRAARDIGWAGALRAWVGPGRSAQDFHFGNWALEVKTTIHPRQVVKIASLEQLDDRPWDALYLLHETVSLVDPGASPTLRSAVEAIRVELEAEGRTRSEFEGLLIAAGYHSVHEKKYHKRGIALESKSLYLVKEGFPRILRDGLHSSVIDAKYQLALNAAPSFQSNPEESSEGVRDLLKAVAG
jgi:hypothetical protein